MNFRKTVIYLGLSLVFSGLTGQAVAQRVMVFSKTNGFRHKSIESGKIALKKMADAEKWSMTFTEDSLEFSPDRLRTVDVVIFLNTTGKILGDKEKQAFKDYIQGGGGFVGIHSASDTEKSWPWYVDLVGAAFKSHPKIQKATIKVVNRDHPATKILKERWTRTDEWYNFREPVRKHCIVLAKMDVTSYKGSEMNGYHPISWFHNFHGGRAFYTGMGHTDESYEEDAFLEHVKGGILWAARMDRVFEEVDGIITAEAEHFSNQEQTETRQWKIVNNTVAEFPGPDPDPKHLEGASGGAYVEILPDSRVTHDDKLIAGTNFSNEPGKIGVLNYKIYVHNPGRYYVWVRAYSTGTEDNGLHVGLNGNWIESGRRMQWCEGKNAWTWESKQRTEEEHCGVPRQIFVDIDNPGYHTISFSMREDGFEFDKWVLSKKYQKPESKGPEEKTKKN